MDQTTSKTHTHHYTKVELVQKFSSKNLQIIILNKKNHICISHVVHPGFISIHAVISLLDWSQKHLGGTMKISEELLNLGGASVELLNLGGAAKAWWHFDGASVELQWSC